MPISVPYIPSTFYVFLVIHVLSILLQNTLLEIMSQLLLLIKMHCITRGGDKLTQGLSTHQTNDYSNAQVNLQLDYRAIRLSSYYQNLRSTWL